MDSVQLQMDDAGEIVEPTEIGSEDTLDIKPVDYKSLTKEELIQLAKDQVRSMESLAEELETLKVMHGKQINDINEFYKGQLNMKDLQIAYKDRKFKMIKDIIQLEGEI